LDAAAAFIAKLCDLAFITDSENGALVVTSSGVTRVPGFEAKLLDTTGAGDAFAAGVLFALCRGQTPEEAARWGNYMAARTIEAPGARATTNFKDRYSEILA